MDITLPDPSPNEPKALQHIACAPLLVHNYIVIAFPKTSRFIACAGYSDSLPMQVCWFLNLPLLVDEKTSNLMKLAEKKLVDYSRSDPCNALLLNALPAHISGLFSPIFEIARALAGFSFPYPKNSFKNCQIFVKYQPILTVL